MVEEPSVSTTLATPRLLWLPADFFQRGLTLFPILGFPSLIPHFYQTGRLALFFVRIWGPMALARRAGAHPLHLSGLRRRRVCDGTRMNADDSLARNPYFFPPVSPPLARLFCIAVPRLFRFKRIRPADDPCPFLRLSGFTARRIDCRRYGLIDVSDLLSFLLPTLTSPMAPLNLPPTPFVLHRKRRVALFFLDNFFDPTPPQ